eukprot:228087-Rhodomonas_salina.1
MKHIHQITGEKEMWAMIFEKAWAKLNLSYEVGSPLSYYAFGLRDQLYDLPTCLVHDARCLHSGR